MDTPRKTKLYNRIAKDYAPKQAEMMICRYMEGLEERIEALEKKAADKQEPKGQTNPKSTKKEDAGLNKEPTADMKENHTEPEKQ